MRCGSTALPRRRLRGLVRAADWLARDLKYDFGLGWAGEGLSVSRAH